MITYPFLINKRKAVKVQAFSLANALDRVLTKHPNKLITTTYARNVAKHQKSMDLHNAHKEAKTLSKAEKNVQFFVILADDEFEVKRFDKVGNKDDVYSIWRNGQKIDEPERLKASPAPPSTSAKAAPVAQAKPEKLAAEKKVVDAVNKLVSKSKQPLIEEELIVEPVNKVNSKQTKMEKTKKAKPAKKATKKVAKKSTAKKNGVKRVAASPRKFEAGKIVSISIADMIKNTKKGYLYRDPQGVIQTVKYMLTRAKQDYVREGMHEYKPEK